MRILAAFFLLWFAVGESAVAQEAGSLTKVMDARVAGDQSRTRIILDLDSQLDVTISALSNPDRLVLDLPQVNMSLPRDAGQQGRGLVKAWRFGVFAPGRSRMVVDVTGPVAVDKSFVIPAVDDQPTRLVIDIIKSDRASFSEFVAKTRDQLVAPRPSHKADRLVPDTGNTLPVIVLDPGHGGLDTGAIGVGGTLEKEVVLQFAKILKTELEKDGKYKVHITREDDTFIPLRDRVKIGHQLEADLFISIHADSVRQGGEVVRGATVYTLSDKASDVLAQQLAETENMSDVIAGVELAEEPPEVADILIDLARRESRNFSVFFARTLVSEMKSAVRLIKNPHRSAGFIVLKSHDVPSVLIELGYLSNRHDEKLLVNLEWRERMAKAIAEAIGTFFESRNAPAG